jgi:hypothetical protein
MNVEEHLANSGTNSPIAKDAIAFICTIIAVLAMTSNSLVVSYVRSVILERIRSDEKNTSLMQIISVGTIAVDRPKVLYFFSSICAWLTCPWF